jgi:hypothetical protein
MADTTIPTKQFWRWFSENERELFDFETDRERLFDRLAAELGKVDPDLTFELGPKDAQREFVISAGGIKRAFPVVSALVAAAPRYQRWKIIGFRPRRRPSAVELAGKRIDSKDVRFTLLDDGKTAGIYLFIPGYSEKDAYMKQIGYLLLDEALGEYDVESKLGLIKMLAPETTTQGERHPLSELPALFDRLVSQLEGSARPLTN